MDPKNEIADRDLLIFESAKSFNQLLKDLEQSRLVDIRKIHVLNNKLTEIMDRENMQPEEILGALTLLAKYIIFHSNFNDGKRLMPLARLLGVDSHRLLLSGNNPYLKTKRV